MEHFNKLTPAEAERLAVLAEECGEVVQAVGKILRHGWESRWDPKGGAGQGATNREKLQEELGDIGALCSLMAVAGDISIDQVGERELYKLRERLLKYVHHQDAHEIERAALGDF